MEFDLPWILPYVRESLRGRSNFNFDEFIDGVWTLLERAGAGKGIEKPSIYQGHTGRKYNYESAPPDIRNSATEAFYGSVAESVGKRAVEKSRFAWKSNNGPDFHFSHRPGYGC